jgi:rhodanese-related sulfurtransferase
MIAPLFEWAHHLDEDRLQNHKTSPYDGGMKKLTLWIGFVLGLTTVSAWAMDQKNCADESRYPQVSKAELTELVAKKAAFIVDVNSDESYKKNHVPTAIHFGSNPKGFTQLLPQDKNTLIVAYCGGPACTAWKKAAQKACEAGYGHIKHFKEGISGWTKDESKTPHRT